MTEVGQRDGESYSYFHMYAETRQKNILFGHVYFVAWPSGYCVNLVRVVCIV
jgi:hypothetical protein